MRIVTLTTDFGCADYASGLLVGVIWSIAPEAEIVVLSHDIPRHDVIAGALMLERSLPYFPKDSVHVMVIDPGVGTQRRAIAARLGDQYFVGPDNGLISLSVKRQAGENQPAEVVHLDRPEYWLPDVSYIFHGRDIFSPVAAHLARGVALDSLGSPYADPVLLEVPSPALRKDSISGQVMHVDHFGNLSTNIRGDLIPNSKKSSISAGGLTIAGISKTFADGSQGDVVALIDSSGYLAICEVNGSAAQRLGLRVGAEVEVSWHTDQSTNEGKPA